MACVEVTLQGLQQVTFQYEQTLISGNRKFFGLNLKFEGIFIAFL